MFLLDVISPVIIAIKAALLIIPAAIIIALLILIWKIC